MPRRNRRRPAADLISEHTPARLSLLLRGLEQLEAEGVRSGSSKALAERLHLNAAQIRKDLACFGEFGVRGVGYQVAPLRAQLRAILGLDRPLRVGIIGAGHLGRALADYQGFRAARFRIVGLFDNDPDRIGRQSRGGVRILPANDFINMARAGEIDVAVVAVPADAAQGVVDQIAQCGVRAILNFAPAVLKVPTGVKLTNVDFAVQLESLSFFLATGKGDVHA